MSAENKELVRRAFDDATNEGRLDVLDEILAPDFVRHDLGGGRDMTGPESIKRFIAGQRAAFPDLHVTIEELVAEGDIVVARYSATGTHRGELAGVAPTGNEVRWSGVNVYRIANGKIAETWQLADMLGLMRQIGAIPSR
jgi:steroid delta-isomerase-like uncharacterized protein